MVFSNINHAVRSLLTIFRNPNDHFPPNSSPCNPITFKAHAGSSIARELGTPQRNAF